MSLPITFIFKSKNVFHALSDVQRYVLDSLLKHQLTRDNTFALIRSCGNEVYKEGKSKEDT